MPNRAVIQSLRLHKIAHGQGSVQLPPNITQIDLSFAQLNANGHMGARKFAQHILPRIAYKNPSIKINVTRIKGDKRNQGVEATMRIVGATEEQLDIRNMHSDKIYERFEQITAAESPNTSSVIA